MIYAIAIVMAVFMVASFVAIRTALDYLHRPKPVTLNTKLSVFKESQTIDNKVKINGHKFKQNPSIIFEEKCVLNPVDEGNLDDIVELYRSYLNGSITDPDASHAPSEFLNQERNPDYLLYLINQKKSLKKEGLDTSWFRAEIKRVKEDIEYKDITSGFIDTLINSYRFPTELVSCAATEERIENFSEKQWKQLSQKARDYMSSFGSDLICEFFGAINDYDTLISYDALEKFSVWYENCVPVNIIKENLSGTISDDTLLEVVRLVDEDLYEWDEAINKVLYDSIASLSKEELRRKYRAQVERK
jgi:hypothetical protein